MRNVILFIPFLFLFISCDRTEKCLELGLLNSNISSQEEYEIMNAAIDSVFGSANFIHILQGTELSNYAFSRLINLDDLGIDSSMMASYEELNSSPMLWADNFGINKSLISDAEIECYSDNGNGWSSYKRHYPDSEGRIKSGIPLIMEDIALVTWKSSKAGEFRYKAIVKLEKMDGKWTASKYQQVYESMF